MATVIAPAARMPAAAMPAIVLRMVLLLVECYLPIEKPVWPTAGRGRRWTLALSVGSAPKKMYSVLAPVRDACQPGMRLPSGEADLATAFSISGGWPWERSQCHRLLTDGGCRF